MIFIIKAEYKEAYKVLTTFNDGQQVLIDLYDSIAHDTRPIVKDLLDQNLFSQVRVEADTLVWPNGFDLAPEFLADLAGKFCPV